MVGRATGFPLACCMVLFSLLAAYPCSAQDEGLDVEVVSDGDTKELSPESIESAIAGTERLLSTCSLSSAHPRDRVDWPDDEGREARWRNRSCGDHLLIRYPQTKEFETTAGPVTFDEILLPFPRGQDIPGIPLSKSPSGVTLYGFCDGNAIISLTCSDEVEEYMPASYQSYCRDFRETGQSVFYRSFSEETCD